MCTDLSHDSNDAIFSTYRHFVVVITNKAQMQVLNSQVMLYLPQVKVFPQVEDIVVQLFAQLLH